MRKLVVLLLAALLAVAGGWVFLGKFQLVGFETLRIVPRGADARPTSYPGQQPLPVHRSTDSIVVASFNLNCLGPGKAHKPQVMEILARIARRYDVLAVQDLCSQDQSLLPQLVDLINASGYQYDYVIGPQVGRPGSRSQYAFLFDQTSVEIDRHQLYTVGDPQDRVCREPLVGWFRVRGPAPEQAFTFTLVNLHLDPEEIDAELAELMGLFRGVRDDGRGEDDVILLGTFYADDRQLSRLPGMRCAISSLPTDLEGAQQYDNLLFQAHATCEFTGRGGVFDFLREYNLTLQEALEVSGHLPVWAAFSIYEGGTSGRVAGRTAP